MLKHELEAVGLFFAETLALRLKPQVQLNHCAQGIPFLGYRVFPGKIRLSPRSKQRFICKFREYEGKCRKGLWSEEMLARHMMPLVEFTRLAAAGRFRENVMARFGVSS